MAKKIEIKCSAGAMVDIAKLSNFQGDLKEISPENLGKLKNRIPRLGFDAPIFIWKGHNKILDGHQRLRALREMISDGYFLENNLVPINEIEAKNGKEAKERLLGYVSQFGKINGPGLYNFLEDIDDIGLLLDDLDLPDFDMDAFQNEFFGGEKEGLTEDDAIPEEDEIKRRAKLGDLWELGKHRLFCGDCTNSENIDKLMDGQKTNMVFTDPPYGVSYSNKNEFLNKRDNGRRIQTPIENDSISDYKKFFKSFLLQIPMADYNSFYITMSGQKLLELMLAIKESNYKISQILIWKKNNHVLGRQDYFNKHELIIYGWKGHHKFYGKNDFSVWEINKPQKSDLHPTMKPVELVVRAIKNSSLENMIIFDGFLGSGSTLIAAEKTNRICYGIELDPHYCDVILQRWEDFTGQKAKKINV